MGSRKEEAKHKGGRQLLREMAGVLLFPLLS